ncbi:MAG: flagellar basal-body MS-ring/collar protein FliF [Rubrivivax sp.]
MDTALAATAPQTLIPEPRTLAEKFAALPLKPVMLLAVGAAALAAVAITLALQSGGSDYRVLYSGLSDKDGGAVISQLSQMNVPYRHAEGGGAIMVPADQVLDLRMRLSNMGLPRNSIVGYELLDTQKFGQTQAGEGMSMKRATEGELMRTIGSLSAVQQVRVHLALPQQNGFFREQQKPSASVMLTLHPGRTLDRTQLAGIVHLVASSVPELSAKSVSVVDGDGNLLTGPDGSGQGLDAQQLQYVQQVETTLQRRVIELLEPVIGRENLRATITADVDFSESMLVSEEFKPNQGDAPAAVKTLQTLESTQPGLPTPAGVPGAQTNQPPVPATAPIAGNAQALQGAQAGNGANSRRESTANYELDRTQRTTRNATGTIKRLSAAVVVNHRQSTDARGRQSSTPLTPQELENLTALVQQGVGFSADRGDTVRVINAPFRAEPVPEAEEIPLWRQPWLIDMLRAAAVPGALAFVALLIVLTTIRPALKSLLAPPPPPPGTNLDTVIDDNALLADETSRPALPSPEHAQRLEDARALARENPVAVANIIRSMINGEQAAA